MKTLTLEQWADLWFRHTVKTGLHPGLVMTVLEGFGRWIESGELGGHPRIIAQSDRYKIIEVEPNQLAIFCRRCCGMSFNANDVQQLYCGHCKQFHS